ncbi:ATP-binding cassette domain-containing protein [Clostridium sp. YIM B02505]|uniref:ATP-binding cassette domain-containing protein n=1 Tax=Clostridium yunnanense TaxID=2800325 RepID=A0ABS1EQY9_9CLOT|nr:ATP-binding cassette domain-containing protein [Clostridium yunnanense]MBK1811765.1 ATP-binding cassette domain-containing protein [Clostridium yunnanense]
MLEVKELTKEFKKTKAVSKISFTVNPGEIVGLLGENGAGKTTTMRMVSTLLKATNGTVLVNSFDINKEPDKVRKEIGILFGGDVGLYDRLTARENMSYFANLYGFSKEEADKRINELAEELDMKEYIDKRVSKFSRGMKQKVSIARSIVHSPSVMLFDEPTTGLDVRATRIIHNFIKKCKRENKTILFSSHSMREVEKLCDRVVIINKGQLVEEGTIEELKKKYNNDDLEEVFVDLIGGEKDE